MAIRPLDMQVMVPKLQEVAQMKHTENQRASVMQNNATYDTMKDLSQQQSTVTKSAENQSSDNHTDAREESKNKYGYKKPSKNKKDNGDNVATPESYHKIDIKV